jgi:hypothetical protein
MEGLGLRLKDKYRQVATLTRDCGVHGLKQFLRAADDRITDFSQDHGGPGPHKANRPLRRIG